MGNTTVAVRVENVSKTKKNRKLLNHISFQIEESDICGFVGPNGAGKTTMIRLLTGLVQPSAGDIYIHGINMKSDRREALRRTGALVESPIFFPYMSGRKNLLNLGRLQEEGEGGLSEKVETILELVGLQKRADDLVKHYSLGMKQRLGIAQALLGNPNLLILDEPSNGLDPFGMKEFRELIIRLNQEQGITFLISSHLIRELELICNRWLFIHHGDMVWQGTTAELQQLYPDFDLEQTFIELMNNA